MRSAAHLTVAIHLDRSADRPMHEQLAEQLANAVDTGTLARDTQVPSTRALAGLLKVSRGVTLSAYEILFARGYIEGRHGSGTYVCGRQVASLADRRALVAARTRPAVAAARTRPAHAPVDLSPGHPSAEGFPLEAWRAAWRQASFQPPPVGDLPPLGLPQLRRAVADHLLRTRGLKLAGHQIVITTGVAHGLRLALDLIGEPDAPVALEDPCPLGVRALVAERRDTVPMPVDEHGARVDALTGRCRAAVVCPDAHEPLGFPLSGERRRRLARWAGATGGYVIEFGGDRVFRPTAGALPRLLDLAGDRTIIVGGFCGLFTPNLRLGYLVVPNELVDLVAAQAGPGAEQASYVTQVAIAHLLADGRVVRRMHQLGRICDGKRRLVVDAVEESGSGAWVADRHGFGSAVVHLPEWLDAGAVSTALRARGVLVPTLGTYYLPGHRAPNALVIGFAHVPDDALERALGELRSALSSTAEAAVG